MVEQDGSTPSSHPELDDSNFKVDETWVDHLVVVSVSGDVDIASTPRLTEAIDAARAKGPSGVIIDLSNVDFFASAGVNVLIAAHSGIAQSGHFAVVADGPATHRPLTLLGVDEIMPLYRTLDDALRKLADG
ncbi:hypothetical protein A5707_06560 [Mycobacterium kyorinense]|uniref:Anti-sigma factor antagonist n=2 Tax=Mycobacterium kyorinense TaxID=487514 RepID=A0A1A2YYI3_9MYCO|nr:hypothetical protein A5707_06560 [Mycobacterium kyorinense]